ncbi:bacterial surface protein 26-residue [Enterococcus moraviensis ATCC BAA-383]|uniref:Bacterial surface protein 26-residue n=3 Tax=Enterococcus moraviensis TaxID=155617 RepID=R2TN80_9ENTE|nr:BspA family leucine-rich repeat surface protein [Enterococcus moraviensis]EOI01602.1 bacterial surface protein 26-residue [Enterococcus moraviensis ATCC BAA-383]EOT73863.1 hypothetical protein I586_00859 [Enterococcus moraviensis ATCC BAA-383]
MKKSVVINGLIVGALGLVSAYGTAAFAEESNSIEAIPEQTVKVAEDNEPTALVVNAEKKELKEGQTQQLTTVFTPENSTAKLTWTSSDEALATVSETGVVTALKAGTVTITAKTESGLSGDVALTIKAKVEGTFGTVPWEWDAKSQTLTFGGGELPNTDRNNNISRIEWDSLSDWEDIKCIKFTKPVIASSSMDHMFAYLSTLETIEGADLIDTGGVTNMRAVFFCCSKLTDVDVSNWNTSKVTSMLSLFRDTEKLTDADVSEWDTINVTNMFSMFSSAESLTKLDLSKWNTSKVTNMAGMFFCTFNLMDLDLGDWDTSQVTDMSSMFSAATRLTKIDIANWNTSNVTDMGWMFKDASNLVDVDVSGWDTTKVTDMSSMFSAAESLTRIDTANWNTSNVTDMRSMFYNSSNLIDIGVSSWDTRNVTDMSSMFSGASSLTGVDISDWDTGKVTSMSSMFSGTSKLTDLDISNWNVSNVWHMSNMFQSSGIAELNLINWDTNNVLDMNSMFNQAVNLTKLDLSTWNTIKTREMTNMFAYAHNLYELNISNWDTSNVKSIDGIFYRTDSLDVLILGPNFKPTSSTQLQRKKGDPYTGRWLLDSSEAENSYESSSRFMANYDGTKPGKYIREKKAGIEVTGIEVTPSALNLTISEESQLQAKILPENATNKKVTYSVADASIASVTEEGLVTGLKSGTTEITALTEDGGFKATTTVNVSANSSLILDPFYLGLDDFITGEIDTALNPKNAQLWVNNKLISTATIFSDGFFELDTEESVANTTDKVTIVILDSKNEEIDRGMVQVEEIAYELTVNDYVLSEDTTVSGKTDYFHTHVALIINGKEIERKLLTSNRQFAFDVDGLIEQESDKVEVVGYRYGTEITRQNVTVQPAKVEMTLDNYTLDTPFVTGKVTGKSASSVRLYVNRRRQETVKIAEDGTFKLLGVGILSPKDKVEVAVLNEQGIEVLRTPVSIVQ